MRYSALGAAMALSAAGCSSILDGTSQEIQVNTYPAGASCTFLRKGQPIATVSPTPGSALVKKTKSPVSIVCDKPGYAQATLADKSGTAAAVAADLLVPVVGWAVDSASGADNKYESPVTLTLAPQAAPPVAQAQTAPPPPTPAPVYYVIYSGAAPQSAAPAMPAAPPGYMLVPIAPGSAPAAPAPQIPAAPAAIPAAVPAPQRVAALVATPPSAAPPVKLVAAAPAPPPRAAAMPIYPVDVPTGANGQVMHLQTGYLQAPPAQVAAAPRL